MPKELTHLIIAEASRKTFAGKHTGSAFGNLLEQYRDHFLWGSVMHDIAFFASASKDGDIVKKKGLAIHGNPDHDTFRPLTSLACDFDRTGSPETTAMTAGALTHMVADTLFHPFVYYFSGNDLARHFRLEALLDTHLWDRQQQWIEPLSTLSLYKNLKKDLASLVRHLTIFLGLPPSFSPELLKALKLHDFTLKLFRSRPGYALFRLIALFHSQEFKNKAQLFYPAGMVFPTPFFDHDFSYKQPVTGETLTANIDRLIETAVQRVCSVFERFDHALSERRLSTVFEGLAPASLETGLDSSFGRHFHFTDLSLPIDRLVSGR